MKQHPKTCSDEFTIDIEIKPANTTAVDKITAGSICFIAIYICYLVIFQEYNLNYFAILDFSE